MLRVVFKGYVKALQARGDGVVASAEGMVGALVKADGSINAIGGLEWLCCGAPSANR